MKPFRETCPADAFLNPDNFRTGWDRPGYAEEQYATGLRIGRENERIHISVTGVWGASRPGSSLSSYETIGGHANTADLLRGFLDSGCPIVVYRWKTDGTGWEGTLINPKPAETIVVGS
jgi:hypothetical protein